MIPNIRQWLVADAAVFAWAGARIFPNQAPQGTKGQYVVYQVVGGSTEKYLGETNRADHVRVQVACWAGSALASSQGASAVRTVMEQRGYQVGYGTSVFEENTERHGFLMDWYLWSIDGEFGGPYDPGPAPVDFTGFDFVQSTPSSTWVINHNLGYNPSVELFDTGGNEFDAEVLHTSVNQTIVTIADPIAGRARLV